jgi:hypothetical protein
MNIEDNGEINEDPQEPNSAGYQAYNSVNKKTGTLISIGR